MKEFCTIKDAVAISLNLEVHQYKKKIRANLIKKSDWLGVRSILNNCCSHSPMGLLSCYVYITFGN